MGDSHPVPRSAAPLTEGEEKKLIKEAQKLSDMLKTRVLKFNASAWDVAEVLYRFKIIKGWERLGYDTLAEYLADPDIGITKTVFFRRVQMWEGLVETKKMPLSELKKIEPSKAEIVTPAIMSGKVEAAKAIADAQSLSYRDVLEAYKPENIERHGQQPDGSTPLAAETEPKRVRCPMCREWTTEDRLPPTVPGTATEA